MLVDTAGRFRTSIVVSCWAFSERSFEKINAEAWRAIRIVERRRKFGKVREHCRPEMSGARILSALSAA